MNSTDDDALLYLEIKLQALIRRVEDASREFEKVDMELKDSKRKGAPLTDTPLN
tara:strand:- start:134976 stop:135137 length:162 start_codon:yes stop_codon:yes gene_type:complete